MAELHNERPESERLRMQLQDASVETDAEFANLQALAEEYLKQADVPDVDADAAWEQVLRLAEPEPPRIRVHSHRAFCAAVAAAVAAGLLFALSAVALAVPSIRETVGRWSDEIFISRASEEMPELQWEVESDGDSLDAALAAIGSARATVPQWFPADMAVGAVRTETNAVGQRVTAELEGAMCSGSLSVTRYEQIHMQAGQSSGEGLQYTVNGIVYQIYAEESQTLVLWNTDNCNCCIELSGSVSTDELLRMLDSIGA